MAALKEVEPVALEKPEVARIVDVEDKEDKLKQFLTFEFEYFSKVHGKTFSGTFKAKRLNLGSYGRMRVLEARLNGGFTNLDLEVASLHSQMAFCAMTLVEFPDWWEPDTFYDGKLLQQVHDHVRHWETSFRK